MIQLEKSIIIHCPVEEVFAYLYRCQGIYLRRKEY
jgi:hypothetical protein